MQQAYAKNIISYEEIIIEKQSFFLFRRQKLLLAILHAFGGHLSDINFQNYLFLFTQIYEKDKSYDFVPCDSGCCSFQSYADQRKLQRIGVITTTDEWELIDDYDYLSLLKKAEQESVWQFAKEFKNINGNNLIRTVYRSYPYYAIKSKIYPDLMSKNEQEVIKQAKPKDEEFKFFTIGYEGKSIDNYLNLLIKNNIKLLCDVRKNPLSRKYGFSKSTLSSTLNKLDIKYVHLPELGITSNKRQALNTQLDYEQLLDEYELVTLKENYCAIKELYKFFMEDKRVAITCFEAEYCMCHRSRVSKALSKHIKKHINWKCETDHI